MSKMNKDAEREKLRKQFEKEAEARKSTEHMSELLLKGATMTNKHCDNCGDPIFRYQGQSFCPTCKTPVDATEDGSTPQEAAVTQGNSQQDTTDSDTTDQSPAPDQSSPATRSPPEQPTQATTQSPSQPSSPTQGDLADARASLIATINSLTQQVQTTQDVGRTRELLQATKEAADALNALNATQH